MEQNQKQGQVTAKMLVDLANGRTLSTIFELACEVRTGVNPVREAIQMDRQRLNEVSCFREIFTAGILFLFMVTLTVFAASYEITPLAMMVFVLCGVSVVIFAGTVSLWLKCFEVNPKITYSGLDEFLVDLNTLCFWLHELMPAETLSVLYEVHVKKAVNDKLVGLAREILELEQQKPTCGGRLTWYFDVGDKRNELMLKHDMCIRIGLASGGFDKWFDIAKREMRLENKKSLNVPSTT